jgi:hypothetical protein
MVQEEGKKTSHQERQLGSNASAEHTYKGREDRPGEKRSCRTVAEARTYKLEKWVCSSKCNLR